MVEKKRARDGSRAERSGRPGSAVGGWNSQRQAGGRVEIVVERTPSGLR